MTNAALNWYKNNDIKLSVELGGEPLPIELQGGGTYTYGCKKRDCWFCEMMHPVEPKLEVVKKIIPVHDLKSPKRVIKQVKLPKYYRKLSK